MMEQLGVFPHNMTSSSIVAYKDYIYVITGNGVDDTHKNIPSPQAPVDHLRRQEHRQGRLARQLARQRHPARPVGQPRAVAGGQRQAQVIAPLGDGGSTATTRDGKIFWKFDSNRKETIYPTTATS
jgi:hypothetical protein